MKTLVIVTHPNLEISRINKAWVEELRKQEDITVHSLYQSYPDFKIDVAREQELLTSHDRIILQFPFYWYSTPSLLKQWEDDVLSYGWAYGEGGDKMRGKELGIAVSAFGPAESYQPNGYNRYTMEQLLLPLQATSNLIGTHFMPIFALNGAAHVSDEQLAESTQAYVRYLKQPAVTVTTR